MPPVATIAGAELPLKLSPTFLERAACPLCLKWSYIDRLITSSSRTSALRGAAAHLAIAVLTKCCLDEKILPSRLSDEHLRRAIAQATPHEIYPQIGPIFEWVSLWRERFLLQPKQLVGFEERMAISERFDEAAWSDAAYRGIVDVIHIRDRTAIVTDYKSQPNILSQAALDQHDKGSFYCWLVSKFYPQIEEFVFRLWYLRYGFYAETRRSRHQLDLFEQQLFVRRQKIAEIERWQPIAGDHCGVCDFNHLCPLGQTSSPLASELVTHEQALKLASELRVKEEWIKRARGQLKVYVEKNEDPIELAGYAYGFRASETVQHDAGALIDPLRENDLTLSTYLVGKTKPLAKLLKKLDQASELRDQLEAARVVKVTTRFKGYKLAGDDETASDEEE
jgi:hypothetical protein